MKVNFKIAKSQGVHIVLIPTISIVYDGEYGKKHLMVAFIFLNYDTWVEFTW